MVPPSNRSPLSNPTRAELKQRIDVAERPVPLADLARALDLPLSRASYHVGVLADCKLVNVREGRASGGAGQPG